MEHKLFTKVTLLQLIKGPQPPSPLYRLYSTLKLVVGPHSPLYHNILGQRHFMGTFVAIYANYANYGIRTENVLGALVRWTPLPLDRAGMSGNYHSQCFLDTL